ncbi:MAG: CHAT domain-containing tetratricopeptide repeat protein [Chitinophagaceae bacterium]
MPRKILLVLAAAVCFAILLPVPAQDGPKYIPPIQQAIEAKDYKRADSIVKKDVAAFLSIGDVDTLVHYVPFIGEIANAQYGADKAAAAVFAHISLLKSNKATPRLLIDAYREAAEFFSGMGQSKHGYDASKEALVYTMLDAGHTDLDIARCEYNLGTYANRIGNVSLSQTHHRRALNIREANAATNPEDIYLSVSAMAALYWYASKYDSADLFYNKSLSILKKMPDNDVNKYYRPGNIYNNMAALHSAEGKTTEGINAMQLAIDNFQKFINSKTPDPKKKSATEGLYEGIDNLAGIYREIGDYGKAGELLRYSYQQKLQKLDPAHSGIFISEILLGQHYNDMHEYDMALQYLTQGLQKLEKTNGDYLFWAADAYYALALLYENKKDAAKAAESYSKSEALYEESYGGQYDNVYMDFLRNASLFYAKNNDYPKASERADKVYKYLVSVGESESLQAFYQLLNIAEINYLTKRYQQAIASSNNALATVNAKMKEGITLLDSVKIEVFKPKAILIQAKSEYELQKNKDTTFLQNLSVRLDGALNILEKRKVLIDDEASINILIADHQELIDFAKKIELQLYELSGQSFHLDRFINLHESALYSRIRSRLDKQQAVQFSHLPVSVQQEELELKKAISASLRTVRPNEQVMKSYILAVDQWEAHLEKVKKEYPAYYNMRYATIFKSLPELQSGLPDNSTVVRYFFTDTSLMALVADKTNKKIVRINNNGLEESINSLLLHHSNEKMELPALYDLYKTVWEPVAPFIHSQKVTIIPDGVLYNLSFDMLATKPLNTYKDLLSNSLLSSYIFSYHYSLFMLGQPPVEVASNENYVAFAPGFSDEVKNKYLAVTKDSVKLDYSYLKLLPQPNTNKLARKIKKMLGGDVFFDESSTQSSFKKNAGGHKIIHIGTHAAYNNIHPEQSGLIFAKNTSLAADSNFLSLYDIYNCDMQSDLTVLTACESGRPGYQDGEGMVSLAHAFNYAGSQRILTALWKIDEQSSSHITEFFIQNLKNGLPTDEALRNAKLEYLKKTEGRMLAPAYWAGLVMMGEPAQLALSNSTNYSYWMIGGVLLIVIILMTFLKYKRRVVFYFTNKSFLTK